MTLLEDLGIDYLLVNCTNKYLTEYSALSENSRYDLTGFSGSTGDALITEDKIYLFVDGRYHIQADNEVRENITVVKLRIGQSQDEEIKKLINPKKVLGIVADKITQKRLEGFENFNIKLIKDPINNFTEKHSEKNWEKAYEIKYKVEKPTFISNLEEVTYISGLRDFSTDFSSKIWAKMYVDKDKQIIFKNDEESKEFLSHFEDEIYVDKASISASDYSLIKKPIHKVSDIKNMKCIKTDYELDLYKDAFSKTDKAVNAIRNYIEHNSNLTEYDIALKLREYFIEFGAKNLSFNPIVAINQHSSQAHYVKHSKETILKEGDLILIDCGAYYESGLATDITRVFVKGTPNELQKEVYTNVLKAFLNAFNSVFKTGKEYDTMAHNLLDNRIEGFKFNHGLGHGIGINVHEAPPNLSQNPIAEAEIVDGMTFTIEPGLYNAEKFGVRLENSCYKKDGKIYSFVKMGYEDKLINYDLLNEKEKIWIKEFEIL